MRVFAAFVASFISLASFASDPSVTPKPPPPSVTPKPPPNARWVQIEDTRNSDGIGYRSFFAPESIQPLPESNSFTVWIKLDVCRSGHCQVHASEIEAALLSGNREEVVRYLGASNKSETHASALLFDCGVKRLKNLVNGWISQGDFIRNPGASVGVWMPADTRGHEVLRLNACPEVARLREAQEKRKQAEALRRELERLQKQQDEQRQERQRSRI
jgi:hypothetical protein